MSRREISKHEFALLRQILSVKDTTLLNSLPKVMERFYNKENIHVTKDYIYITGDIPVALVAHLDTVHAHPPTKLYHDKEQGVIWTPEGLGADDRAGVFAIITIVEAGYRPSIIFTMEEEVGGKGAFKFSEDYHEPLVDTNFLIELDRQGVVDAVYYDCGNVEFQNFITSFGFVTDWGTFSDIAYIGPEWDRASVNLSIGYFNEHTKTEFLQYRDMFATIRKVKNILENCGDQVYDAQSMFSKDWDYMMGYPGEKAYWDKYLATETNKSFRCDSCSLWFPKDSRIKVFDEEDGTAWSLCPQCTGEHATVCTKCGVLFLNPGQRDKRKKCRMCELEEKYAGESYDDDK